MYKSKTMPLNLRIFTCNYTELSTNIQCTIHVHATIQFRVATPIQSQELKGLISFT